MANLRLIEHLPMLRTAGTMIVDSPIA